VETLVEQIVERLGRSADCRVVFGDPITAGTKTIVAVARVAYGVRGGGGGVVVRPVGVLEVSYAGTKFIEFGSGRRLGGLFLAGLALGILATVVRRR
jgi:uncharacterized spore protein YtfJ